jgi:hypothetical protein
MATRPLPLVLVLPLAWISGKAVPVLPIRLAASCELLLNGLRV